MRCSKIQKQEGTDVKIIKGCWNWVLKDAVLFDKPVENVKGKLSFWDFNMEQ